MFSKAFTAPPTRPAPTLHSANLVTGPQLVPPYPSVLLASERPERSVPRGHSFANLPIYFQAKLTSGQSGDRYERQADPVAAQVVEQIYAPASTQATSGQPVQRQKEAEDRQSPSSQLRREVVEGREASPALATAIEQARGGGQPLAANLQRSMGRALGVDFSRVRIMTDAQADQMNRSLQAKAFTIDHDIFFRQGAYEPGSRAGQELIAHELTHVVQQNSGTVRRLPAITSNAGTFTTEVGRKFKDKHSAANRVAARQKAMLPLVASASSNRRLLQRSVGYEFQCRNWQFFQEKPQRGERQTEVFDPGRNKAVTGDNTNWHLESDGSEPEFIIHYDGNPIRGIRDAVKYANQLAAHGIKTIPDFFSDSRKKLLIKSKKDPKEDPITADAQITAGIRYDRMGTLIGLLSQRQGHIHKTRANEFMMQNRRAEHYKGDDLLLGTVQGLVRQHLNPLIYHGPLSFTTANDQHVENVVGFLALLASYLSKAPEAGHAYMKDMPLLSKSDLGTAMLNSPILQPPWVAQLNELKDVVFYASQRRNRNAHVYPPDPEERNNGPTIQQWLDGLFRLNPVDELSSRRTAFVDQSMGPYNRVDHVGPDGAAAPIIEFRRIKEAMPVEAWEDFVATTLAWIANLNDPNSEDLDYHP